MVTKDTYWEDKEQRDMGREAHQREVVEPRIIFCSAQSDAVAIVAAALAHDLIALGNANKSAKLGLLLGYVDEVTQRLARQRMRAAELLSGAPAEVTAPPVALLPTGESAGSDLND